MRRACILLAASAIGCNGPKVLPDTTSAVVLALHANRTVAFGDLVGARPILSEAALSGDATAAAALAIADLQRLSAPFNRAVAHVAAQIELLDNSHAMQLPDTAIESDIKDEIGPLVDVAREVSQTLHTLLPNSKSIRIEVSDAIVPFDAIDRTGPQGSLQLEHRFVDLSGTWDGWMLHAYAAALDATIFAYEIALAHDWSIDTANLQGIFDSTSAFARFLVSSPAFGELDEDGARRIRNEAKVAFQNLTESIFGDEEASAGLTEMWRTAFSTPISDYTNALFALHDNGDGRLAKGDRLEARIPSSFDGKNWFVSAPLEMNVAVTAEAMDRVVAFGRILADASDTPDLLLDFGDIVAPVIDQWYVQNSQFPPPYMPSEKWIGLAVGTFFAEPRGLRGWAPAVHTSGAAGLDLALEVEYAYTVTELTTTTGLVDGTNPIRETFVGTCGRKRSIGSSVSVSAINFGVVAGKDVGHFDNSFKWEPSNQPVDLTDTGPIVADNLTPTIDTERGSDALIYYIPQDPSLGGLFRLDGSGSGVYQPARLQSFNFVLQQYATRYLLNGCRWLLD